MKTKDKKTKDEKNINTFIEDWSASDRISIYIGLSLAGIGVLNAATEVPDVFIIGASLAGLCFTLADPLISGRKFINIFTALGTLCFFLLPIILLSFPMVNIFDFLNSLSEAATFFALGIVLIALSFKSQNAKISFLTDLIKPFENVKDAHERFEKDIQSIRKEQEEILVNYSNRIKELEELEVNYNNRIKELEEQLEFSKEGVQVNESKEDSSK